jgi:hypothetical protein
MGGLLIFEGTASAPTPVSASNPLPVTATATAAEGIADDAAFTVASSKVLPVGFLADETSPDSVNEGDIGAARMTLDRQVRVYSGPSPQAPASYRTAVVAADVLAVPGTVTCTKLTGVGAMTGGEYIIKVVAGNAYGRTTATAGNTHVTTEGSNLGVRAAFAQVTGATYYDIYASTDSDPLFVGRVTEAQRLSGIVIDTVNHTTTGGTANGVDIWAIGTGLAAGTTAAVNTAYNIPASPVSCVGFTYCDFDIAASRTGDAVAPALVVVPYLYNSRTTSYYARDAVTVTFGGTTGAYGPLKQRIRVEVRGNSAVALVVQSIAGTGMSVDIDATLS